MPESTTNKPLGVVQRRKLARIELEVTLSRQLQALADDVAEAPHAHHLIAEKYHLNADDLAKVLTFIAGRMRNMANDDGYGSGLRWDDNIGELMEGAGGFGAQPTIWRPAVEGL